jgi:hypothetical protein
MRGTGFNAKDKQGAQDHVSKKRNKWKKRAEPVAAPDWSVRPDHGKVRVHVRVVMQSGPDHTEVGTLIQPR